MALAEFLQWHGGCSVAVDMWQRGHIAKLGPLRWLTEQVKAADFVLIVRPQDKTVSRLKKKKKSLLYILILGLLCTHPQPFILYYSQQFLLRIV